MRVGNLQVMRIDEAGSATQHLDAIPRKLREGHVNLRLDHLVNAERQIGDSDLFLYAITYAIDALVLIAGEVHHGFAHRLAGNGARVNAGAANHLALLDERYSLAELRALNGRTLSCRAGTDNDQ